MTALISFLCSILIGKIFINWISHKQFGQNVREEGPNNHKKKQGTPIFGGVIFLVPVIFLSFFFNEHTTDFWFLLTLLVGYALIGFADDFIKVFMKRNLGLTAKQKLLFQIVLAAISYALLAVGHHDTTLFIPFVNKTIDLSYGYFFFFLFMTVGTTNATNLTDGLDGLLSGLMVIALLIYSSISFYHGETESLIFASLMIGSLLGFLVFNKKPARIFMGDTGSLSLGGLLAGIAILTKTEFLLVIIGGVFVIEAISVIVQVLVYKKTQKRVFKMAPLHHHYELKGWSEQKVVSTFYVFGMCFGVLALMINNYV